MCKIQQYAYLSYQKGASKRGANFGALDKDWDSLKFFYKFLYMHT